MKSSTLTLLYFTLLHFFYTSPLYTFRRVSRVRGFRNRNIQGILETDSLAVVSLTSSQFPRPKRISDCLNFEMAAEQPTDHEKQ